MKTRTLTPYDIAADFQRMFAPHVPRRAANEPSAAGAMFFLPMPWAMLTRDEAVERFASDGDAREWIKTAKPGQSKRLNISHTLHCLSLEDAEHSRKAHEAGQPRPGKRVLHEVSPSASAARSEDWSAMDAHYGRKGGV